MASSIEADLVSLVSPCKKLRLSTESEEITSPSDNEEQQNELLNELTDTSVAYADLKMDDGCCSSTPVNFTTEMDYVEEEDKLAHSDNGKDEKELDSLNIDGVEHIMDRKADVETACSGVHVSEIVKRLEQGKDSAMSDGEIVVDDVRNLNVSITSEGTDDLNSSVATVVDMSSRIAEQASSVQTLEDSDRLAKTGMCSKSDHAVGGQIEQDGSISQRDNCNKVDKNNHLSLGMQKTCNQMFTVIHLPETNLDHRVIDSSEGSRKMEINAVKLGTDNSELETRHDTNLPLISQSVKEYLANFDSVTVNDDHYGTRTGQTNVVNEAAEECTIETGCENIEERCVDGMESVTAEAFSGVKTGSHLASKTSLSLLKSGPLCASTPVLLKVHQVEKYREKENKYPHLETFKPHASAGSTGHSSKPLCTSTPLHQTGKGLRVRDMNLPQTDSVTPKQGNIEFTKRLEFAEYLGSRIELYNDMLEGCNVVHTNNQYPVKQGQNEESGRDVEMKRNNKDRCSKRGKKLKDMRKEKFKEYMGPGLTSETVSTNTAEINNSKKSFLKNTDIETCTLTEYKGFGLTGPLPEKHAAANKQASAEKGVAGVHGDKPTGAPSRPAGTEGLLLEAIDTDVVRQRFNMSLSKKPAGLEGLLLQNYSAQNVVQKPLLNTQSDNFGKKVVFNKYFSGPVMNSVPNLHAVPPAPHSILRATQSHGTLINNPVQWNHQGQHYSVHKPCADILALQPDEGYPVTGLGDLNRGENSEDLINKGGRFQEHFGKDGKSDSLTSKGHKSDSHTSKGEKSGNSTSDKVEKMFDPTVLQCEGKL